jgi:acyl-CoA reductase-like NAD-dependent aldehyde dehydrogenase
MVIGELLIGGQFFGGACDQTFSRTVVKSPYSDKVIGAAAEGGAGELNLAIHSATEAYKSWRHSSRNERRKLLRRISALVIQRQGELASLLVDEIGKPIVWAEAEVARLALTFEYAADLLLTWGVEAIPVDPDPRGARHTCIAERFPRGPIFCMAPYNWPFNLVAHKIAPAIASGNSVVVKTSPLAPLSTLQLGRLINEAGAPAGLVNVWNGPDRYIAAALQDPRVAMLSFTGSARVGWILGQVADRPVLLELGGDAFAIVEADAGLEWAVKRTVAGSFGYGGQVCISIQHVLVHEKIYKRFKEALIQATLACPTGDPALRETVCGPVINDTAVRRIEEMVREAIQLGAKPLVQGKIEGNLVFPTLLEDVPTEAALMREEVFGPVVTLSPYANLDEAISIANRSQYGIQTGLFTHDVRNIERAFRNLETGGLVVNDYPTLRFDNFPYGGVKRSGFGREGVTYAMDEMTQPKVLLTRFE